MKQRRLRAITWMCNRACVRCIRSYVVDKVVEWLPEFRWLDGFVLSSSPLSESSNIDIKIDR